MCAKNANETTPSKTPIKSAQITPTSKTKSRLKFEENSKSSPKVFNDYHLDDEELDNIFLEVEFEEFLNVICLKRK